MEVKIQSQIKSYGGKGSTVYALYTSDTGRTHIAKESKWQKKRQNGIDVFICDADISGRDSEYKEEDIIESISAFYSMEAENEITIDPSVTRCNPSHAFEFEGVENGKRRYRIKPDITNAQMATLAIAHYVHKSVKIQQAVDMSDDLFNLLNGDAVTI